MKRLFKIALPACAAAFALLYAAGPWIAPLLIERGLHRGFARLGFQDISVESVERASGVAVFKNIQLDRDGFSTVESVSVGYAWPRLLLSGMADSVGIRAMTLTADTDDNGALSVAGWTPGPVLADATPDDVPFISGALDDFKFDIATSWGGLRVEAKGQLFRKPDGSAMIQAALWGVQSQMSFDTLWQTQWRGDGSWSCRADVREGKLELPSLSITRIGGALSLSGPRSNAMDKAEGTVAAGAAMIGNLPLQTVSLTLDNGRQDLTFITEAKASGVDGLTFRAETSFPGLTPHIEGTFRADRINHLLDFIEMAAGTPPEKLQKRARDLPGFLLHFKNVPERTQAGKEYPFEVSLNGLDDAPLAAGRMTYGEGVLTVSEFSSHAMGAEMKILPFSLSGRQDNPDIALSVRGLDLRKLPGFTANGLLDGEIPLHIEKGRFSVRGGLLASRAPGVVAYGSDRLPGLLQDGGAGVKAAAEALRNFHYDSLKVKLDGEFGRDLAAQIEARGRNPDLMKGRAIDLKLNVAVEGIF